MSNGNLPEIPKTWFDFLKEIALLIAAIGGATSAIISGCNNAKVNQVKEHQVENAQKLDAAKDAAVKAETKLDSLTSKAESIEKKTDAVKSALPPK